MMDNDWTINLTGPPEGARASIDGGAATPPRAMNPQESHLTGDSMPTLPRDIGAVDAAVLLAKHAAVWRCGA